MPSTPLGFLLHQAFVQGKTSYGERGNKVALTPGPGETVLVFATDRGDFAEHFGIGAREPRSDVILYYAREEPGRPLKHRVLFVELKGNDHGHAVEQLDRVVEALKQKVGALLGKSLLAKENLRAVIVSSKKSPDQFAAKRESFMRRHQFPLVVCRPDEGELRKHLP